MSHTIANVAAIVRNIAEASPDNVYERPDGEACSYHTGSCSDGSRGCIVGQALKQLGFDTTLLPVISASSLVIGTLGLQGDYSEAQWLDRVQRSQDGGYRWADAVRIADRITELKRNDPDAYITVHQAAKQIGVQKPSEELKV